MNPPAGHFAVAASGAGSIDSPSCDDNDFPCVLKIVGNDLRPDGRRPVLDPISIPPHGVEPAEVIAGRGRGIDASSELGTGPMRAWHGPSPEAFAEHDRRYRLAGGVVLE